MITHMQELMNNGVDEITIISLTVTTIPADTDEIFYYFSYSQQFN